MVADPSVSRILFEGKVDDGRVRYTVERWNYITAAYVHLDGNLEAYLSRVAAMAEELKADVRKQGRKGRQVIKELRSQDDYVYELKGLEVAEPPVSTIVERVSNTGFFFTPERRSHTRVDIVLEGGGLQVGAYADIESLLHPVLYSLPGHMVDVMLQAPELNPPVGRLRHFDNQTLITERAKAKEPPSP